MLSNSAKKMDIKQLNFECLAFRNAILKSDRDKLSVALKEFPSGSCGCCKDLLLYHFKKINFPNIQNIYDVSAVTYGYMDKIITHGWLKIDDIIIDLTISQFDKRFKKVIFDNDRWHRKFKIKSKIAYCELKSLEGDNYTNLISDYHEIMKNYKIL